MGLLGELLNGLAGGMAGRSQGGGGLGGILGGGSGGGGLGGMLGQGQGQAQGQGGGLGGMLGQGSGGGLGGMLGGALGGGRSSVLIALLPVVLSMLANRGSAGGAGGMSGGGGLGGLGGLLERMTQHGMGQQASSWVGTGENQPLSSDAVSSIFGPDQISHIASQAGVSEDDARSGLSEILPEVVDHFTPNGQMPQEQDLSSSVDDYVRQLNLPR